MNLPDYLVLPINERWKVIVTSSPPNDCPQPQLGRLCGMDAVGAIIGIALGCAAFVALMVALLFWLFYGRVSAAVGSECSGG